MLEKLSLDKTQKYERCVAMELISKMMLDYIDGRPGILEIGAEQGDISQWDDFVMKKYDSSTIYIQIKRQTTSFSTDAVDRNAFSQKRLNGQPKGLSVLDKVFKALAAATIQDLHNKDRFWICLPEEGDIRIKKELSVREFRHVRDSIKETTRGENLENQANKDKRTKNACTWLSTWCDFIDWNHIVRALKLLEIKTFGYENDIEERIKDNLGKIFNSADIDVVYALMDHYLDANSTYAGAFRPRELLGKLQEYLLPQLERWTMFRTDGRSWFISGINDLEKNSIDEPHIERIQKVVNAFWEDASHNGALKIKGCYSKKCKMERGLMRLSLHIQGLKHTFSTQCDLWRSDMQLAVGGTLGRNGRDDFEDSTVARLEEKDYQDTNCCHELKTLHEKEEYAETFHNEMHMVTLKKTDIKMREKIENMPSSDLRDRLEQCWDVWHEKFRQDEESRKKFFSSIMHPTSEGESILGELRVGCKTVSLIADAIFLTMVVSVVFNEDGKYDWTCLETGLKMRTIGLKYWSGPAGFSGEVIEIENPKGTSQLLSQESEEVLILSGTSEPIGSLLEEDLTNNSSCSGLLSDRKQPQLLVTHNSKFKKLVDEGNIIKIRNYLQNQIDEYLRKKNDSIEIITK